MKHLLAFLAIGSLSVLAVEMASLNKEFKIRLDESRYIASARISIRLINLTDTRCPRNVKCISAGGPASLEFEFKDLKTNKEERIKLSQGVKSVDKATVFKKYSLKLVKLTPNGPKVDGFDANEYEATLLLKKL